MALFNVGVPPQQLPLEHARERSRSPTRNLGGKLTGIAKRWNDTQGFGFIKPDDGSEDIFCHRTSIEDGDCFIEGAPLAYIKGWDDRKNKERAEQVTGGSHRSTAGAPQPYGGGAVAYGAAAAAYGASAGYPPAAYAGMPPSYAAPPGYAASAAVAEGKMTGMVKRWNEAQGFGFIKPDDGTEDLFVHRTSIEGADALPDGARALPPLPSLSAAAHHRSHRPPPATHARALTDACAHSRAQGSRTSRGTTSPSRSGRPTRSQ